MSSDVYIDLFNPSDDKVNLSQVAKGLRLPYDTDCETFRLGHLGEMSYFGYDLLDGLRFLHEMQPRISPSMLFHACRLVQHFRQQRKEDQDKGDEYCQVRYGYHMPDPWDDVPDYDDFIELAAFEGCYWEIRVD